MRLVDGARFGFLVNSLNCERSHRVTTSVMSFSLRWSRTYVVSTSSQQLFTFIATTKLCRDLP